MRLAAAILLTCALGGSLAACRSGNGERLGERVIPLGQPVPKGGARYTLGDAYYVAGVRYQPHEDPSYDRVGIASWYGELFHGRRTADGEIYDMDSLSAAHPTLPLPCYARVTNLQNGRVLVVRVNDRGPYANDRVIDLSRRTAQLLDVYGRGTARVRVQYLGRAPLNGDDSYERRYLAQQRWTHYAANDPRSRPVRDPIAVGSIPNADDGERPPIETNTTPAPTPMRRRPAVVASNDDADPVAEETTPLLPVPRRRVSPKRDRIAGPPLEPTSPPVPPQRSAARAAKGSDRVTIQAGSFKSQDNAVKAKAALGGIGSVAVDPTEAPGGTYYRVRVGPFASEADAAAALPRVMAAGYSGARIVAE